MTSEIVSCSPSILCWKSGVTGWRELITHSPSLQITKICNIFVKPRGSIPVRPAGLCFSPGLISPSPIAQEIVTARLTPSLAFIPSTLHREPILPPALLVSPIIWNIDEEIRATTLTEPALLGGPEGKTFVRKFQRHSLLGSVPSVPGSGHPGSQRTLSLLQALY